MLVELELAQAAGGCIRVAVPGWAAIGAVSIAAAPRFAERFLELRDR